MTSTELLCVLIALPFASATAVVLVPSLRGLAGGYARITWPVGVAGLILLLAGLLGALPEPVAVPLMLVGGAVSGLSMFWSRAGEGDGDGQDWRRWWPAPENPPPDTRPYGPDWALFDRLRADWERADRPSFPRVP